MNKLTKDAHLLNLGGYVLLFIVFSIFITLLYFSSPAIFEYGTQLFSSQWNPMGNSYGIFPFITGTLLTTFIAFLFSVPLSISLSLLLGEFLKDSKIALFFESLLEIISGIPSIIVGFWGAFFLSPLIISGLHFLTNHFPSLKSIPLIGLDNPSGLSIFTASIILASMIVPFSAFLGKEAVSSVPNELKEASYALGATTYETVKYVILPTIKSALIAGFLLSIGRALGETMAITLVIGNKNFIPDNLFSPGQTMASLIANEFSETSDPMHSSAIIVVALVLFLITMTVNIIGRSIIKRLNKN